MFDPASPLGAIVIAVLGAAVCALIQLGFKRVKAVNPLTPLGMITCVIIGALTAVSLAAMLAWLWAHVALT